MTSYITITNIERTIGGVSQPKGSTDGARQRSTTSVCRRNHDEVAGSIALDVDPVVATIGVDVEQE